MPGRMSIRPSVTSTPVRLPPRGAPRGVVPSGGALPSGCGCGTSAKASADTGPLVYSVGSLGFDFGTEARRDALYAANGGTPILTNEQLQAFLTDPAATDNRWQASQLIWTLSDDRYPLYAIRPHGFASDAYDFLTQYLDPDVQRLSVPGWLRGHARLMNGWTVPVIEPDIQGFRPWSVDSVVSTIVTTGTTFALTAQPAASNQTVLTIAPQTAAIDWMYFGTANLDHSANGNSEIVCAFDNAASQFQDDTYSFAWDDGTFVPSAKMTIARAMVQQLPFIANDIARLVLPCDPTTRVATLYLYAEGCQIQVIASTTPPQPNASQTVTVTAQGHSVVTLTYAGPAASSVAIMVIMQATTTAKALPAIPGRPQAPPPPPQPLAAGFPTASLQAATLAFLSDSDVPDGGGGSDEIDPDELQLFMDRIYFELRNLGATPEDRAQNFAATQAYFVTDAIAYAIDHDLNLQDISVAHSPLCRPGSECWDVTITFFDPDEVSTTARKTFKFTIDVSDVKPVMIGQMYSFNSY